MTDQEKEQDYKDKIKELETRLERTHEENVKLRGEMYTTQSRLNECEREKNKLLDIIKNLSEGIANS